MPNYCYNRLFAKKEFINKYLDNDGDFNFNKLIPMPESYRMRLGKLMSFSHGMIDRCNHII